MSNAHQQRVLRLKIIREPRTKLKGTELDKVQLLLMLLWKSYVSLHISLAKTIKMSIL